VICIDDVDDDDLPYQPAHASSLKIARSRVRRRATTSDCYYDEREHTYDEAGFSSSGEGEQQKKLCPSHKFESNEDEDGDDRMILMVAMLPSSPPTT
jgi:hypothetical protein